MMKSKNNILKNSLLLRDLEQTLGKYKSYLAVVVSQGVITGL